VLGANTRAFISRGRRAPERRDAEQIEQIASLVRRGLARGRWVSLDALLHTGASEAELKRMFRSRQKYRRRSVRAFAIRRVRRPAGALQALEEV